MIATESGPQALTYAQYKALKKRREITHTIIASDDAVEAHRAAQERLQLTRIRGTADDLATAEAAEQAAERAVRDAAIVMRLRALPREGEGSFAVLKAEHPPRPEDDKQIQDDTGDPKARARWNLQTFPPALVAACLVSPTMTPEEAAQEKRDLNDGEWSGLYGAALAVNREATDTGGLIFS